MTAKIVLSGMQPSGILHIGNYIGGILNWKKMIAENPNFQFNFMVADLHSLTSLKDARELRQNIIDTAACYAACGIDFTADNISIFQQSKISEHAHLAWIFQTITPMGWLERMTQFKDKTIDKDDEVVNTGLFTYPALMAADILLYDADFVPVGNDQKQHIELTRDIAEKFNRTYHCAGFFKQPEPIISEGARIMSLADGRKKMSKSDPSELSRILLTDTDDEIAKKISKAKTDSIREIYYDKENRPDISNLITIAACLGEKTIETVENECKNLNTKEFKDMLSEMLIEKISPIRGKINEFRANDSMLKILADGNGYVKKIASKKIEKVNSLIGL